MAFIKFGSPEKQEPVIDQDEELMLLEDEEESDEDEQDVKPDDSG